MVVDVPELELGVELELVVVLELVLELVGTEEVVDVRMLSGSTPHRASYQSCGCTRACLSKIPV